MPKIEIEEYDYTPSGDPEKTLYTILIPGKAKSSISVGTEFKIPEDLPKEGYSDIEGKGFEDLLGTDELVPDDKGYQLAKVLNKLGMHILYVVVDDSNYPGGNGSAISWSKYTDIDAYDFRYICSGGALEKAANMAVLSIAKDRGNSIALLSAPEDIANDYTEVVKYINGTSVDYKVPGTKNVNLYLDENEATKTVEDWESATIENDSMSFDSTNGKYGAMFVPSIEIPSGNKVYTLPGYAAYLGCYCVYGPYFNDWYAFAGSQRGQLPWTGAVLSASFGSLAINALQTRDVGKVSANPVVNNRSYGKCVWGNRTLHPNKEGAGLTASSFLNIRMLCCDIKDELHIVSQRFTFDPNSSTLWTNFYNAVTPLLEKMKSDQGIKGYKLTQTKASGKAVLSATLRIIPIEAVEDFKFRLELTDSIEVTEE